MRGNRHASSDPAQLARTLPESGMGIDHTALTDAGMGNRWHRDVTIDQADI